MNTRGKIKTFGYDYLNIGRNLEIVVNRDFSIVMESPPNSGWNRGSKNVEIKNISRQMAGQLEGIM